MGDSPIGNVVNDLIEKLDSKRNQETQKLFRTAYNSVALCELQDLNGLVLRGNY